MELGGDALPKRENADEVGISAALVCCVLRGASGARIFFRESGYQGSQPAAVQTSIRPCGSSRCDRGRLHVRLYRCRPRRGERHPDRSVRVLDI
jgi:hypothetical protein